MSPTTVDVLYQFTMARKVELQGSIFAAQLHRELGIDLMDSFELPDDLPPVRMN